LALAISTRSPAEWPNARDLFQQRLFKPWDDVQNVPGFDKRMVDHPKSGGAQVGS
jgi:hypothetical protein